MSLLNVFVLLSLLVPLDMSIAHTSATDSSIIVDSFLPRGFNGTVHSLASDFDQNIYASCFDPTNDKTSSAFMWKLDAKLHTLWTKKIETFPGTPVTMAFSTTMGLYAVSAMKELETDIIHIWVLEIDADDGKTLQAVQIDSEESISEAGLKAFVATSERGRPTIYVSYIALRASQRETVTKVFKIKKMDSSVLFEEWRTEIYDESRVAVSHAIAENVPDQGIFVAQITRNASASMTDTVSVTMTDRNGSTMLTGSFPTMDGNAKISCLESDENGLMYLSESPSHLHHLSFNSLNTNHRITKLWSESLVDVLAMHVLRNGSLLYALANRKGTSNDTSSENSITFMVYNYSGGNLLTERHDETNTGAERILTTFTMRNEAVGSAIVLGGHFRLTTNDGRPGRWQISLGTYIFPILDLVTQELLAPSPVPQVPNLEEESNESRSQYRRFVIGIPCGISAVVVLAGLVLCWRRRRATLASKLSRNALVVEHATDSAAGIFRHASGS